LAYLTKDRAEVMSDEEYRAGNLAIREQVLSALDPIGTDRLFVASSGAAYRADDPEASPAMRSYGELKATDEREFASWAQAMGRRLVTSRIFSLSGAYINKPETYAMASFVLDALADRPITIRAERPVYRSYVAVRELLALVLQLLAEKDSELVSFDSGGEPVEMAELAATVLKVVGGAGMARPRFAASAPADHYHGDREKYLRLLASFQMQHVALEAQVAETANFLVHQGRVAA
jgi:nucleoside-diphosphate-sugar epimerase